MAMSNIKWNYWIPVLGVAAILQNHGSYLNNREERLLVLFHVLTAFFGLAALFLSFI